MDLSQNGTAYKIISNNQNEQDYFLLIHGIGLNHQIWQGYELELAKLGQVINYDLWGHGQSQLLNEKPSLKTMVRQIIELLDELQIQRCHIIGFSVGGMINRRLAMDYPNRVKSLVIMNSPHERSVEAQKLVEQRAKQTQQGGFSATQEETINRWFSQAFIQKERSSVEKICRWVSSCDIKNYTYFRELLAHGVKELIRPKQRINHKTLIITCENDSGSTSQMAQDIHQEIEGSVLKIIPKLKHLGMYENPSVFLQPMLSFFKHLKNKTL